MRGTRACKTLPPLGKAPVKIDRGLWTGLAAWLASHPEQVKDIGDGYSRLIAPNHTELDFVTRGGRLMLASWAIGGNVYMGSTMSGANVGKSIHALLSGKAAKP